MLSAVCNAVLGPCAVSVILYEHWGANIRQLLALNFASWQPIESLERDSAVSLSVTKKNKISTIIPYLASSDLILKSLEGPFAAAIPKPPWEAIPVPMATCMAVSPHINNRQYYIVC